MTATVPSIDLKKTKTIRLRTSPSWLPPGLRNRPSRIKLRYQPCKGERRIYRRRKKINPSDWAPKHRKVTYGPLAGSYWEREFMPHINGIMDASFHPSVKEIGNCKSPQGAASAGNETLIGYLTERRPGPILVVYPDRDTARKRSTDYLQPMFDDSPCLSRLKTGIEDDMSSMRIKLQVLLLYMAWAGSATSLGNVSIKYLFADEVDKYPDTPNKKEGGIMGYIRQRVTSFKYGAKIWWISTPTNITGQITKYMTEDAEVIFDYHAVCPHCGHLQLMDFEQIMRSFDKSLNNDPKTMQAKKLAGYVCKGCGVIWSDRDRDKAVKTSAGAHWRARDDKGYEDNLGHGREMWEYLRAENPEKICFHSPAWISPLVSLSEIAAQWMRGLKDKDEMKTFLTQYKAEAWKEYQTVRKTEAVMILRDERPEGLVPGNNQVAALVAGADTQDYSLIYNIQAIGFGLERESWQIRHGELDSMAALDKAIFEHEYKDADGKVYPVHLMVQDAMGHRTSEVYDYSLTRPGRIVPYKGDGRRKTTPITWSRRDSYPGTNKPLPEVVNLLNGDANFFKNMVARKLKVSPTDPGALHLHSMVTEEFAQQLCAEYLDENGLWQCPSGKPNHYWDALYMCFVAADVLQIKFWPNPADSPAAPVPAKQKPAANPFTGGMNLYGSRTR